jgi:hypothetical protein
MLDIISRLQDETLGQIAASYGVTKQRLSQVLKAVVGPDAAVIKSGIAMKSVGKRGRGRPSGPAIPCGLCGEVLYARNIRAHPGRCPKLLGASDLTILAALEVMVERLRHDANL